MVVLLLVQVPCCAGSEPPIAISYDRDVRPILSESCFACHGFDAESRQADLRLDVADDGGKASRVIIPGDPKASELIARIESTADDDRMPPPDSGHPLTPHQIDVLRAWIQQGAAYEQHWAFIKPVMPSPPPINSVDHPIDRFIQAKLLANNLATSPPADRETLLRRLSLDLIGLPPTIAQIDDFLAASNINADTAYRQTVDRLLASPHYGERWGRWWLDQARYADSHGYSIDNPREIWLFRDWVVNAFNADLPFDEFTIRQLAGDLLPSSTTDDNVATGFHRNTQINQEGGIDPEQFRIDSVFDRVATTGTVWLGLSIGCAQCHDHKFDPISQKEYYRLFAFFNNQDEPTLDFYPAGIDGVLIKAELRAIEKHIERLFDECIKEINVWEQSRSKDHLASLGSSVREAISIPGDKRLASHKLALMQASSQLPENQLSEQEIQTYQQLRSLLAATVKTMVLKERKQPRTTTVFIKGDFTRPDDEVTAGTPSVLHAMERSKGALNRLDLALWIMHPDNPLTARVIVNRVWQQYFGLGIVETENDFGLQGVSPTHPELHDWLAIQWIERRWSFKELHRLIVTSHAYQQSSFESAELRKIDPLNRLLSRQNRIRLDAEIVRDVALTSSGMLATKIGGPPVYPPIPDGVMSQGQVKREWTSSLGTDRYRRGLYTFTYRNTPAPSLNVFDAPEGQSSCTRRMRSNTPLQALTLMNDQAFFEFAQGLEKIIDRDGIVLAFRRCTGREPDATELAILARFDSLGAARVLLNLDETITRE